MVISLSHKSMPLSIQISMNNFLDKSENRLLLIISKTFNTEIEKLFSSLEMVSNFFLVSLILFRSSLLKDIKYENLQCISSFYMHIIEKSFFEKFTCLKLHDKSIIKKDQINKAFLYSRFGILEILIALQVQRDIKIENLNSRLKLIHQNHIFEAEDNLLVDEFNLFLKNLDKKFHKENAYYQEYLELRNEMLPSEN